jgi:hypothetical protein
MKQTAVSVLLGVILLTAASPASAANKEHQQLMADLRMLQEQSQLLQNLIGSVTDAIKAVNTRLDQQAETTRKAFADQKLVIDNVANDLRILREKVDDNNVRVGSIGQELDALRQSGRRSRVDSLFLPRPRARPLRRRRPHHPLPAGTPPVNSTGMTPAGCARRLADYTAGQWSLAIEASRRI